MSELKRRDLSGIFIFDTLPGEEITILLMPMMVNE